MCLDSDINAEGKMKLFIHTRNDDVIAINHETRLPPNYIRFIGLIEQLYDQKVVPSRENALLELRHQVPLEMLVNALKADEVIIMDPNGEQTPLAEVLASSKGERIVLIIGGFSRGTFRSDLSKLGPKRVSMGTRMMKAWTVASKTLRALESVESPETATKPKKKAGAKKTAAKKSSGARPARKKKAA